MSQVPSERRVTTEPSGRVTLAVEKDWPPALPDVTEEPALDDTDPPPDCIVVVWPPMVVEEETLPLPAFTEDEVPLPLGPLVLVDSMTVQVVPSSRVTLSAWAGAGEAINSTKGRRATGLAMRDGSIMICSLTIAGPGRAPGTSEMPQQDLPSAFLAWPGGQFLLLVSSCAAPAAEPPVPTELLDVPSPAEVPPVPSVEAEPEPLPEPAAEPPVPTELLDVPPPAEVPPVPSVEAEPEPPSVPDELPPVPMVLLDVPPPADVPPVPTVLLDWA
jgi:hypothetical protein